MINRSFLFWDTSNYILFFFFLRQRPFGTWPVFLRALPSITAGKLWLVQVPSLAPGYPLVYLEFCSSLSPMWTLMHYCSSAGTSLPAQESKASMCHVGWRNSHVTHLSSLPNCSAVSVLAAPPSFAHPGPEQRLSSQTTKWNSVSRTRGKSCEEMLPRSRNGVSHRHTPSKQPPLCAKV